MNTEGMLPDWLTKCHGKIYQRWTKSKLVKVGAEAGDVLVHVSTWFLWVRFTVLFVYKQKQDLSCCISSSRDRLNIYEDNQI